MKNKRVHGGAIAGSVIIAIIITMILFSETFILVVNRIFTSKFIAETISNVRFEEIEIPVEVNGRTYDSISDAVVGEIQESNPEADIAIEDVETFFEESGVSDLLGEKMSLAIDAIMNNEETAILTNEEIMQFVEDNEQLVEDTFDIEITEEDKKQLETELEESRIEEIFTTQTITSTIYETEENPLMDIVKVMKTFFSTTLLIVGYVVVVVLFVGLFFLNKRQLWYAGPYIGIPAIVVGAGVLVTALGVKLLSAAIAENASEFIRPEMFNALIELLLVIGVIHLLLGIVITVVSSVVKHSFAAQDRALAADENNVTLQ